MSRIRKSEPLVSAETALETPVMSNAIDVNRMPELGRVIDRMLVVQRDRYYGGQRDETTALLAYGSHYLESRDADAEAAQEAILDVMRDVPWIEHDGSGDPPMWFPEYVQVRFRDGEEMLGVRWDWDQNWCWTDADEPRDGHIMAYRAMPASSKHSSRAKPDPAEGS